MPVSQDFSMPLPEKNTPKEESGVELPCLDQEDTKAGIEQSKDNIPRASVKVSVSSDSKSGCSQDQDDRPSKIVNPGGVNGPSNTGNFLESSEETSVRVSTARLCIILASIWVRVVIS